MKHFLIISAIITAFSFIMCNNSSADNKPAVIKSDTTNALLIYKDLYDGEVKTGIIPRVVKDSFMFVTTDDVTKKKQWGKDTTYIETAKVPVDSLISRQRKIPIKDSLGRQNYIGYPIVIDKRFVRSGWDHVDSVLINGLKAQQ